MDRENTTGGYGGSLVHVREEGGPRAPQFRVQVEEITSQERGGKYLPAAAEVPPRRISRAHDN